MPLKLDLLPDKPKVDLQSLPNQPNVNPTGQSFDPVAPEKPDLIYTASGTTPELLREQGRPYAAAFQEAGRDLVTVPAHYFNMLLLNAPRSLSEKAGFKYPEKAESPVVDAMAKGAGAAGAIKTGSKILAPKSLIGKGAVGAAEGFAYSPTEDFTDVKQRGIQALYSGALSMALPFGAGKIKKFAEKLPAKVKGAPAAIGRTIKSSKYYKQMSDFTRKTRSAMFQKKKDVGTELGKRIDDLDAKYAFSDKRIDLSEQFQFIKDNIDDIQTNPGLRGNVKSAIRKSKNKETVKLINDLIENPNKATDLTLKQVQDIKTTIKQAPSIKRKLGNKFADYSPGEIELLDLIDDIRSAQTDVFPEMVDIREPYKQYMNAYRNVKNSFKPKSLEKNIKEGFGSQEIEEMVEQVLPEDAYKQIQNFRAYNKARDVIKKGGGALLGLEGLRRTYNYLER